MPLSAQWEGAGLYQLRETSVSCVVCRGPLRPGYGRCYQCTQHQLLGEGRLADAVAPVSYAVRGTEFAVSLGRYKSGHRQAAEALLALLLAFLGDHGPCVWRAAGMREPSMLAVVPSGCGRRGPHPLLRLVTPYLGIPLVSLAIRHGEQGRDLNADRFVAGRIDDGADVLLLDDTWVSGASAQSAAVALKGAGAARVAVVVLGRHLNPAEPRSLALATEPYEPGICVFHSQ